VILDRKKGYLKRERHDLATGPGGSNCSADYGHAAQVAGRIVFISSESAIQIPVEMIHYGMTKTAQLALSRGLAETCAGTGVTVNAVLPGPTHSACSALQA
jgi:NAD(P)-dependent dehydrogenase (short-subunit alcohol dehydrogenase family)